MGLIRTLLALSVVDFHWAFMSRGPGFWPLGMPNGVVAVQAFYVISGFYMSLVLAKKYQGKTLLFYRARLFRLLPIYWVVSAATLILYWAMGFPYFRRIPRSLIGAVWYTFSNASLVGQDWNVFFHVPNIVPQAWTLGLEISFYAFAPLLVRCRTWALVSLIAASCAARATTYAHGYSDDPWNYRFFPFEIGWFLLGMISHRGFAFGYQCCPLLMKILGTVALGAVLFVILDFSAVDASGLSLPNGYVGTSWYTLQFTLVAALPFVFALTKNSRIDNFIGEFSYPIYVCHYAILTFALPSANQTYRAEEFLAVVLSCSALLLIASRPIERWRHRVTGKRILQDSAISATDSLLPLELRTGRRHAAR